MQYRYTTYNSYQAEVTHREVCLLHHQSNIPVLIYYVQVVEVPEAADNVDGGVDEEDKFSPRSSFRKFTQGVSYYVTCVPAATLVVVQCWNNYGATSCVAS